MTPLGPLQAAIHTIRNGETLTSDEIAKAFRVLMSGSASDGLIGAFLGIMATRIPTGNELFGAANVMKEHVKRIDLPNPEQLLDTCGTGGAPKTFNVSTAAGIVAAACGVRVAKHGNRSRTGRGSAEVLEQLGINIDASIDQQKHCLKNAGICFCFAPKHHKAVASVMPVRKALTFPTIFNLLGPLTNPCNAGCQLLGVWDDQYVTPMAEALLAGGTSSSAVVHSQDGLDEISISAPTRVLYINNNTITEDVIHPEDVGLKIHPQEKVTASDLQSATSFIHESLVELRHGAPRDMILLNSSVSLFISGRVTGLKEGVKMAAEAIDSGLAHKLIEQWSLLSKTHTSSTGEQNKIT